MSPLAQPRNVIGGYILSSLVGVTTRITLQTVGVGNWITAGAAVAFALMIMNFTKTVHPPGGACALIAVIGGDEIVKMEFNYVLVSAIASMLMVLVALVGNNIIPGRQYPTYWW